MASPEELQDADLAGWDWRAALKVHPIGKYGGLAWLAEATGRNLRTVYAWSAGQRPAPVSWVRDVARALDHEGIRNGTDCRTSQQDPEFIPSIIGSHETRP